MPSCSRRALMSNSAVVAGAGVMRHIMRAAPGGQRPPREPQCAGSRRAPRPRTRTGLGPLREQKPRKWPSSAVEAGNFGTQSLDDLSAPSSTISSTMLKRMSSVIRWQLRAVFALERRASRALTEVGDVVDELGVEDIADADVRVVDADPRRCARSRRRDRRQPSRGPFGRCRRLPVVGALPRGARCVQRLKLVDQLSGAARSR